MHVQILVHLAQSDIPVSRLSDKTLGSVYTSGTRRLKQLKIENSHSDGNFFYISHREAD